VNSKNNKQLRTANQPPYFRRRIITLGRIVRTGGINFFRNAWLSVAATAVMVITLTIILFSFIANATFANTVQQITDRIDISVFLKDSVNEQQREELIARLKNFENVRSVEYVSKDQALEDYKEQNADNLDLLVAISQTDNPLPASLRIKPNDPERIEEIRQFLEQPDIKELQSDETSYSGDRKEAVDKITQATGFLRTAGIAGVIVFTVISMLIIFNTIQMAIFNRREELTIMRLLGANSWYIRGPFIVETVLYGIVAAVISISVCSALFNVQASAFDSSSLGLLDIQYANRYFSQLFWKIMLVQLAIGITIGAASSYIATRRYLKFKTTK
jgi:cell division transport system permease protein